MKKTTLMRILIAPLYIIAAPCLFLMVNFFFNEVPNHFENMDRMLPFLISMTIPAYIMFAYHAFLYPRNFDIKKRGLFINGIVLAALGAGLIFSDIILVATGTLPSLITGGPVAIYPLDNFIASFFYVALGVFAAIYSKKWLKPEEGEEEPKPEEHGVVYRIFVTYLAKGAFVFFACIFFGDLCFFFHTLDYTFVNFGLTFPVYLMMLTPTVELALYEFKWRHIEDPAKKSWWAIVIGALCLVIGLVSAVWTYIGIAKNPTFLPESMTGCFPATFITNKAIGPLLLYALNLVPGIWFLLVAIFSKKKGKEE